MAGSVTPAPQSWGQEAAFILAGSGTILDGRPVRGVALVDPTTGMPYSATDPLPVTANSGPDLATTGTLTAAQATLAAATSAIAGSCVALALGSGQSDALFTLTGTWTTSSVVFDGSVDPAAGTTNWVTLGAHQVGDTAGAALSPSTSAGTYYVNCASYAQVRARMSVLGGADSITVLVRASTGPNAFAPQLARVGYKEFSGLTATAGAAVTVANAAADLLGSTDAMALGMRSFSLHINAVAVGATIVVYGSNTGATNDWIILPLENITGSAGTVGTAATTVGIYKGEVTTRYIRVRQTAYTSGTTTGVVELSAAPAAWNFMGVSAVQNGVWTNQAANLATNLTFTSASAAGTTANTAVTGLGGYRSCVIAATLAGATGGTLDIYIQVSPDGGTTWVDYLHFAQLAAAAAATTKIITISKHAQQTTITTVGTGTSPALAANTVVGGEWYDRMRVVQVAGAGTSAGAVQTILLGFSS